ncbi:MAG: hypothetical protein GY866_17600 [Proteobacteria bacterium]|nr:hypothetical protein [Pseudomonadota bacterium]
MNEVNESPTDAKSAESETPEEKPSTKSTSSADAKLLEDVNQALELPLPDKDDFWKIDDPASARKGKKRLLGLFKKKEMTEEELGDLRQEAENAPGRARVKVQMLKKKYATSTSLAMLSAFCTYRMILNSNNRRGVLDALKAASKEAAFALMNDGLSLFNCETFFTIYFDYLNKFKRFQVGVYKTVQEGIGHKSSTKKLAMAIKICDSLLDDKDRAFKVLNQIKGKFKSSSYTLPWEFSHIQMAGKKVEQSEYKTICGPAEAREMLVYTMALADIFARIPILSPLIDTLLGLIPESTNSLFLRKSSIQGTRNFTALNAAIREGDMDKMRTMGRQIFKTSHENMQRVQDQPIKQSFEADPYFHLSRIGVLTFGIYSAKEQKQMLMVGLKSMQKVAKLDMTKNHVYTDSAITMVKKLSNLLSEPTDESRNNAGGKSE